MRYKEWGFLLIIACLGIMTANFVGFKVAFLDSLPGVCVLLVISCIGVVLSKIIPLKLPIVAYCSIVGLLAACPISPVSSFVTKRLGSGKNLDKFIYIHQAHSCCYRDERKPH